MIWLIKLVLFLITLPMRLVLAAMLAGATILPLWIERNTLDAKGMLQDAKNVLTWPFPKWDIAI